MDTQKSNQVFRSLTPDETFYFLKRSAELIESFDPKKGDFLAVEDDDSNWDVAITFLRKTTQKMRVRKSDVTGPQITIDFLGYRAVCTNFESTNSEVNTFAKRINEKISEFVQAKKLELMALTEERINAIFDVALLESN